MLDALEPASLDDCDEATPLPLGEALELACDDDAELLPDVGVVLCVLPPLTDTLTPDDWLDELLLEDDEGDADELANDDDAGALLLTLLAVEPRVDVALDADDVSAPLTVTVTCKVVVLVLVLEGTDVSGIDKLIGRVNSSSETDDGCEEDADDDDDDEATGVDDDVFCEIVLLDVLGAALVLVLVLDELLDLTLDDVVVPTTIGAIEDVCEVLD